ncbi:hypothetical protein BTA51_02260 [Hahella sp. CCB-MM4]|uniref:pectin acetylesterase-family hydrolase n=1 Tax=Hahella sp. (strain CCB-MM4) TaxID=1926491 RepID=UPI000B9AA674|nr:pectin acetylesterase-family hydrolase [Hahella sp. CCB-MM4]OZG75228.1 hypothetical protein BTA51_02260 [Hahella sp. CCB-MM4]
MHVKTKIKMLCLAGCMTSSLQAAAELGDYSAWTTFLNLFSPQSANNPVTSDQRDAEQYPLLSNPSGFDDGFSPGNYLAWQTVQLHPDTGAVCGNGSPYKFFVNRVAHTSNMIIYLEGGGACWDYESCTGQTGIRGARNPNGVPDDYMSLKNPGASMVSPLVVRLHPWTRTETQGWNMVYVPYCTGDTYTGDKVAVYEDPKGEADPLVWHHNGVKNMRAIVSWLKDNIEKPGQMLVTGCSAGGTGTLGNYYPIRRDMDPSKGYMLNDSGPIYPAPVTGSTNDYPSLPLHNRIRDVWGLDGDGNGPLYYLKGKMPTLDLNNLGTLTTALADTFPNDRLGHTQFWEDLNYSSYSYERFYPDIYNDPDADSRAEKIHQRWYKDTGNLMASLNGYDNFGYYLPRFRGVNESHCTTIIEFNNSDIQEEGLELENFVDNVISGSGTVMEASEEDTVTDHNKGFNLLYWLLDQLL